MNLLEVRQVPSIADNLPCSLAIAQVIPQTFSDIISVSEDLDCISITMVQGETHNNVLKIPSKIYNPSSKDVVFPRFILEVSTLFNHQLDYFNNLPFLILNQNQLLYLTIHHRLSMLRQNNVHYTNLLKKDIAKISNFGEYTVASTMNAKMKNANSYVIISPFIKALNADGFSFGDKPIGEILDQTGFEKSDLIKLFRDLPIQPGSESAASESNKFAIYDHSQPFYKACGYGLFKAKSNILQHNQLIELKNAKQNNLPLPNLGKTNGEYYFLKSIFDTSSPNIPSRFKTHIVSDAYKYSKPSTAIFKEDIIDFETMSTDGSKIDAFVVFDDINPENDYLTCGEAEVSKTFACKQVYKDEIIKGVFKSICVKVGEEFVGNQAKHCVIGLDEDEKEVSIQGFKSVKIMSIEVNSINNSYKITARCKRQVGSGRLYGSAGSKMVTKPRHDLGRVSVTLQDGSVVERNVDIVCGMNATKGKANSIMLAKAALMFRLGQAGDLPYLDSMNEAQINELANKFTTVEWVDRNGTVKNVLAGVLQVSVNELAYMFNNVKLQSFMPEAGRYLEYGGYHDLFEHIWATNIDPDAKEVVLELTKILHDNMGYYAEIDNIPVYSVSGIREMNVFDPSDLVYEKKPLLPHVTELLNEDYNKGFYLDLRYRGGGMVRFPSAKLLNSFTGRTAAGDWIYSSLLIQVSNCLECCIIPDKTTGRFNVGYLNNNTGNGRKYRIDNYYDQVKKILHTEQNFVSTLIKPKVLGVNLKQMSDCMIPQGTVVIFDSTAYKKLAKEAGYTFTVDENGECSIPFFRAMCIRNPVLWKSQVQILKVWSKEHFRKHLALQGIDMDKEFVVKFCKELLMMNPRDLLLQQSDTDGDIMPVFVPKGLEAQEMLARKYEVVGYNYSGVQGIVEDEAKWLNEYRDNERDSNKHLKADVYKLFKIPFSYSENNGPTFTKYFADSIIAKGDVGSATVNNWIFQTLCEIYYLRCSNGEIVDPQKGTPISITSDEINYMMYLYSRCVQDIVVRGIKHVIGGSNEFKAFLLTNMSTSQYSKHVASHLVNNMGADPALVNKMLMMVHWGNDTVKVVESIMKFISLHNKGTIPASYNEGHFNYIVDHTFYGKLVKPVYHITRLLKRKESEGFVYSGMVDCAGAIKKVNEYHNLSGYDIDGDYEAITKNSNYESTMVYDDEDGYGTFASF